MEAIKVLFIPVSGPAGAGEYYRCLTLAEALLAHQPTAEIHFCVSQEAPVHRPSQFHCHDLSGSPTRCSDEITDWIEHIQPHLVVFDSTLRTTQIRAACASGAQVVFISSRQNRRKKGFAWHKLRYFHEHWVLTPPDSHQLTAWEQWKVNRTATRVRFFSALLAAPCQNRRRHYLNEAGFPSSGYTLFVSGGGGGTINGNPAADVFQQAARQFHARSGKATLFIAGPLAEVELSNTDHRLELRSVPGSTLADLIAGADLVVSGGGSIVQQSLALQTPCLAIPAGGRDQPARIAQLHGEGVIATTEANAEELTNAAMALADDHTALGALRNTSAQRGYSNGAERAVELMLQLTGSVSG